MPIYKLDEIEIRQNASKLDEIFGDSLDSLRQEKIEPTEQRIAATKKIILNFVNEHAITLNNLLQTEDFALLEIITNALRLESEQVEKNIEDELQKWKVSLHHAVAGEGTHVAMHAIHSSGMAADLLNDGYVPAGKWGTDLDIKHCMGSDLATDPRTIRTNGKYILPPVSLTESFIPFQTVLEEAFNAIKSNDIQEKVSLNIPVNCGNNHWRLAKIAFKNLSVTSAVLWDSMSGDDRLIKKSTAFRNFETVVSNHSGGKDKAQIELAGIQQNGHSCMDFCIREAYRGVDIANSITREEEANALRLAIVKQIAANHSSLGPDIAGNIEIQQGAIGIKEGVEIARENEAASTGKQAVEALLKKVSTSKDVTPAEKEWQITFDSIFAAHLQELYDKNKDEKGKVDEKDLIQLARNSALREVGFFSTSANKKDAEKIDQKSKPTLPSPKNKS